MALSLGIVIFSWSRTFYLSKCVYNSYHVPTVHPGDYCHPNDYKLTIRKAYDGSVRLVVSLNLEVLRNPSFVNNIMCINPRDCATCMIKLTYFVFFSFIPSV